MNKLTTFFFGVIVVTVAYAATVYNIFSPGGALSGTWNSQNVDLTQSAFLTGPLGVTKGGSGVATLTGLVLGNGASAFSAYPGTSCTNQFPRSLSTSGVATCATVANTDLANSSITINGTSTALGGTRTLTLASADFVNQGTTTTVLHGNAAGNPSFGAVSLTTDVTGVLPVANGGTGSASAIILSGTTGSIGGGALLAGQCSSGTVTITGATTSMVALADPQTYPGDGTIWDALITSANTATVKICAIVALTPSASLYNVRVLQ